MKSSAKTLLIVGALGAAAIYAASKASAASDAQEAGGSLGGDDSLTNDENPFAGIDPNYQYPSDTPQNILFYVLPDGSVVPTSTDPSTGEVTIPTPDGPGVLTPGTPSAPDGYANPSAPAWYENPLIQGAGFAAGYIAVQGSLDAVKKITTGKSSGEKLVREGTKNTDAKLKGTEKSPINEAREKMGFKANERLPEQEIMRAKYTTESDFSKGKISEVKGTGKIMADEPTGTGKVKFGETKTGKIAGEVGETAGKALIVGHVVGRSFGAWNEYGSSYLEPRTNSKGEVVGATAGSTAKAVGVTAAVGTTGILGDLFSFGTGLIYRPPTNAEDRKGETTGWFATEKDLYSLGKETLTNPGATLSAVTGFGEASKAFTGSSGSSSSSGSSQKVSVAPAPIQTNVTQTVSASVSSAPATITSSNVSANKSSSSSGSSSSSKATSSSSSSSKSSTTSSYSGATYNTSTNTYTSASGAKQSMAPSQPAAKAATQVSTSSYSASSYSAPKSTSSTNSTSTSSAKAAAPAPAKTSIVGNAVKAATSVASKVTSSIKSLFSRK